MTCSASDHQCLKKLFYFFLLNAFQNLLQTMNKPTYIIVCLYMYTILPCKLCYNFQIRIILYQMQVQQVFFLIYNYFQQHRTALYFVLILSISGISASTPSGIVRILLRRVNRQHQQIFRISSNLNKKNNADQQCNRNVYYLTRGWSLSR